jgi:hypothetical protein
MARVARDAIVKQTGVPMPMFATLEHAYTHIRNELKGLSDVSNG